MKARPNTLFCNADQSGFVKEMHGSRALAPLGVKNVERVVQSTSAISHSYTIMPLLYSNGTLGEKLFVVMQEPRGLFPRSGHFVASNLEVRAGHSHIMTKRHMVEWFESCVFGPTSPQSTFLLVDSWTSFKDTVTIQATVPANKELFVKNIPPGATSMIQPLDLFFFQPFKVYSFQNP